MLGEAWQFDAAAEAIDLAIGDAGDDLTALAAVDGKCWLLLRQGRLAESGGLAASWADDAEPRRMSKATPDELAAWGLFLVRVSNVAVRDNRPDDAREALRLAKMAASGVGRDIVPYFSPAQVFGPGTIAMIQAEHAMIQGRPDVTLAIGSQLAGRGFPVQPNYLRHRLDVAHAHAVTRQHDRAVGVLRELRVGAPEWLGQQRYARDILSKVITRRRTLTDDAQHGRFPYPAGVGPHAIPVGGRAHPGIDGGLHTVITTDLGELRNALGAPANDRDGAGHAG